MNSIPHQTTRETEDPEPRPLRFTPLLKQTIWGGRRLGRQLGKPIGDGNDYAESWEVVDHGRDQSVVADGPLGGLTLAELLTRYPAWLMGRARADRVSPSAQGSSAQERVGFPLLLKYLDCNRVLSVQVHPDDRHAAKMEPPDLGKTEAWYVVAAEPESLIYAGLQSGVDRETLAAAVEAGQTEQVLHSFHPQPGDCVFIPAGTVHALGAGLVIAEIQQSSDTTFRLFDWNRVDDEGRSRPLHVEASLEVTDYTRGPVFPRPTDPSIGGWQSLVSCEKFVLVALTLGVGAVGGDDRFHILTVPRGTATLRIGEAESTLATGETLLIPAAMGAIEVEPAENSVVLAMRLPEETV